MTTMTTTMTTTMNTTMRHDDRPDIIEPQAGWEFVVRRSGRMLRAELIACPAPCLPVRLRERFGAGALTPHALMSKIVRLIENHRPDTSSV